MKALLQYRPEPTTLDPMRTESPGLLRAASGRGTLPATRPGRRTASTTAETDSILGPFVVRRFLDFGLTESMMCRLTA